MPVMFLNTCIYVNQLMLLLSNYEHIMLRFELYLYKILNLMEC